VDLRRYMSPGGMVRITRNGDFLSSVSRELYVKFFASIASTFADRSQVVVETKVDVRRRFVVIRCDRMKDGRGVGQVSSQYTFDARGILTGLDVTTDVDDEMTVLHRLVRYVRSLYDRLQVRTRSQDSGER